MALFIKKEESLNLSRLADFAIMVVIASAIAGNLNSFNRWVHKHTIELLWASRTATWGSPHFWPEPIKRAKNSAFKRN